MNPMPKITETDRRSFACEVVCRRVATPCGEALAGFCAEGLCYLGFCIPSCGSTLDDVRRRFPHAAVRFEEGEPLPLDICVGDRALCLVGTPFQRRVWRGLLGIGRGERISYGDFTRRILASEGQRADRRTGLKVRAVAAAIGANPISLVVPCHRVVGADGSMHGYFWGVQLKRRILDDEGGGGL